MPRKRRRESKRVLAITFSVIFIALLGVTLGLPYLAGPAVEHFPASYVVPTEAWMKLVPMNAISAGVIEVSNLTATGVDYSQFLTTFINVYQLGVRLTPENLTQIVTYVLPAASSTVNSTEIDIFRPTAYAYGLLLSGLNDSSIVSRVNYGPTTIYHIYNNDTVLRALREGYLAFYNGFIVYSQGAVNPQQEVENAMDFIYSGTPSLFDNRTVQSAVYASLGGRSDYLALYYVSFPIQVPNFTVGAKTVWYASGDYHGTWAFGFNDSSMSRGRYDDVTKLYTGGYSYYLLDNFVVGDFTLQSGGIENQILGF